MTENALQLIFSNLLSSIAPHKNYQVKAVFYDTKSIRHTIELKRKYIQVKIAKSLRDAPEEILHSLGIILYSKLFRFKIDKSHRRAYNKYLEEKILPNQPLRTRKPSARYKPEGNYYNLNHIFEDINRTFFKNALKRPVLGWSLKKSYTRLGFYSEEKDLLVISRIFDSSRVPLKVLEYMMYHEMLHILIPTRVKNGRRSIHPREFKEKDRAFPDYDEIQKWIKKKSRKL
jgi:predicted metal-dependent hydrolase